MMQAQLGMIPSWQFSQSPGVNIKLNDHVRFPEGWTQRTIQPVGPAYAAPARIANGNFDGLGLSARAEPTGCCDGGPAPDDCCNPRTFTGRIQMMRNRARARRSMRGMQGLGVFDSWAYDNRKWLVLGGLGLIAAAGLGVTAAILK